jgi:6-phosphogluconolactonase
LFFWEKMRQQMNPADRKFFYSGSKREITERAAALIIAAACHAVDDHGYFSLVLAGGNSPGSLYEKLAQGVTSESLVHYALAVPDSSPGYKQTVHPLPPDTWLFQGDERCVPPDHPESNYRMIRESLLRNSGIAKDHFFRMAGENVDTEQAARAYEAAIRTFFFREKGLQPDDFPLFDLVLLGLGEDGHTASLFAENTEALEERNRWVIAVNAPQAKPPGMRLTLTLPIFNHARNVLFFTTGREKCELAQKIFLETEKRVPASLVNPQNGRLYWFAAQ